MESYATRGTCAKIINYSVEDGILTHVDFERGCPGNLIGLSRLAEGLPVQEVINRLKGIRCGLRGTSCPDQLATALEKYLANEDFHNGE
jgi:uncharacterized protein (TIGR03905 family)